MLDPGSPCHNYPTSSRVAWRHALPWELDGRAQQRWSKGESREPHIAVSFPASQPKALMVDVSGLVVGK